MKTFTKYFVTLIIVLNFCYSFAISYSDVSLFVRSPNQVNAGDVYRVDITINKYEIEGFSKFETFLPNGFKIEPIKYADAVFTFKDNVAKFIWLELPNTESFNLSYNIIVPEYYKGKEKITGVFYYIFNNKKHSQGFNSLLNIKNERLDELILLDDEEKMPVDAFSTYKNKDIYFKVQLAAFSKKVSENSISGLYTPACEVKEEFVNGLYKYYYVENFYNIDVAIKFKNLCGVQDAFIMAFYKNKKITIKEALAIIEQEK